MSATAQVLADAQAEQAPQPTLSQVAERAGVSVSTVRRWVGERLVPQYEGNWTAAAAAQVRIVARLRARGHTLGEIRQAVDSGALAGYIDDLLAPSQGGYNLQQAARVTGLEAALIQRLYTAMGFSTLSLDALTEQDIEILRYAEQALQLGLPLVALLQMLRVYGQALAQIADAEVRLFHIYVHEPMMRDGVPGLQIAEAMTGLVSRLLPLASPFMDYAHGRYLGHFIEQDVIGHMETDMAQHAPDLGRVRVGIAFADLAGYTRLTEERGDEEAVGMVERFVEAVESTLPHDARVIKTLGDEVMVVGPDPVALIEWAVDFQRNYPTDTPPPRIGIHCGEVLYRDGDYYGREVNQAARVVARAAGGEVLATRAVAESATAVERLRFDLIGEIRLKGFSEPTELYLALPSDV
ncbi:MAG TPA: adenylate cyclase regulatory domain-containing protein [Solirubrobacteraceae bacterium]|jgi:adenylate cyclase